MKIMIAETKISVISVLLIEDNPGDQLLIKEQLIDSPVVSFRKEVCSSITEALEILEKEDFDVVILDPGLPDSSGMDSLNAILKKTPSIPVIVLTISDSDEMGIKSIRQGAQDFLNKNELQPRALKKSILYAINRNRLERELTLSLRLYESTFEQAVAGFAHISPASTITRVNNKFCSILGYAKDELIGKPITEITHPDDIETDMEQFRKLVSGKVQYYSLEKRLIRKDGQVIWTNITRATISKTGKGDDSYFTTLEDITERKTLLAELHKQKALLEKIFSVIPVGITIIDGDGDLISSNKKFDEIWEGAKYNVFSDLQKYHAWKIETGEEICIEDWAGYKALKNKETIVGEILKIGCFDGSRKVIINSAIPLIIEDNVAAVVMVIEDITRLAETESELKNLLAEKEVLVKESNHRIKNNLQLMSSLLNLQAANSQDMYVRRILNDSINRIASVSFLHDYLYRSSSMNEVNIQTYLQRITEHISDILLTEAGNIKIVNNVDNIEVDSGLAVAIGLVISELITNAVKYAFHKQRGGIITIDLKKDGRKILLQISDNGKGMRQNVDLREVPSLGLQIVYAMVTQYHGSIEYAVDGGTTFTIKLPLKKETSSR